jgi:heme-degrading monooxygenase HmoA
MLMANAMEIVQIRVAPENREGFLATRHEAMDALRSFPGFVSAHLAQIDEVRWIDVVLWRSRAEALAAAEAAPNLPILARHFAHINEIVSMEHAEIHHEFAG